MITVRRTRGAALAAVAALALGVGAPSALAAPTTTTHHQTATSIAKAKKAKQLARKAALAKQAAAKSKTKAAARYLGVTGKQLSTALASGQSLADVAQDNGKTISGLVDALLASAKTFLGNAVTSGDITQAQSDAILAGLTRSIRADVNRPTSPRPGAGFGHGPFGGNLLGDAATYIGITQDALRTALQGGTSLATVATDNGKTADGLIQALVDAAKAQIAQHVTVGDLTQAQADQIEADLTQRVTHLVNRTGADCGPGGPGGPRGGVGPGGFGGAPEDSGATTTSSSGGDAIAF